MKLAFKHENRAIAHSAKNILEMNGIECLMKNDHANTMGGEFGIGNTLMELWVLNDKDYFKASELIGREVLNPQDKPSWNCSQCAEENEGSFDYCWNCQNEHQL